MVNPDFDPTREEQAVLEVLKDEERANPYLIREQTDMGKGTINTALTRLTSAGWVRKVTRGLYEYVDDPRDDEEHQSLAGEPAETAPTPTPSSDETTPEPGAAARETSRSRADVELPGEISDEVWHVVDEVSASWDDDEERLKNRRQAAATVLQHAVETGDGVGKSHPIVDAVQGLYPVEGQNAETYWRKNIRDVLKAVGEYSRGKHAYTVTEIGEDGGPYDPTDEFE